jgi:hypothetical protein
MWKRILTALAVVFTTILAAPSVAQAQTFKTEKFDIKGDGGTDYVAVEAATGRVFVSRATHMMVVDGATLPTNFQVWSHRVAPCLRRWRSPGM